MSNTALLLAILCTAALTPCAWPATTLRRVPGSSSRRDRSRRRRRGVVIVWGDLITEPDTDAMMTDGAAKFAHQPAGAFGRAGGAERHAAAERRRKHTAAAGIAHDDSNVPAHAIASDSSDGQARAAIAAAGGGPGDPGRVSRAWAARRPSKLLQNTC